MVLENVVLALRRTFRQHKTCWKIPFTPGHFMRSTMQEPFNHSKRSLSVLGFIKFFSCCKYEKYLFPLADTFTTLLKILVLHVFFSKDKGYI